MRIRIRFNQNFIVMIQIRLDYAETESILGTRQIWKQFRSTAPPGLFALVSGPFLPDPEKLEPDPYPTPHLRNKMFFYK